MASTLTPMAGTAHEWITSDDVTMLRIEVLTGKYNISLVFNKRIVLEDSIKLSVSISFKDEYS